jgi:hypothetical protein
MADLKPLPPHLIGGNFLFTETDPAQSFTPEDIPADVREMAVTAEKFMDKDVFPKLEALEHQEDGVAPGLFRKAAGELGLLAVEFPEEHGGLGLGKVAGTCVLEQLSRLGGFGITCNVHTGIGSGPIAHFGTAEQKARYLPKFATGEWMAAYCLSETGSGSDALSLKCKAVLSPDGKHYLLNGVKMWITNAAWADVFVVFAKVDGKDTTAFIVEKTLPGVSTGKEEHKLGLKSSSTRRVILDNTPVPVANVLGEVGKGGYIALNILNYGRYALGAAILGSAKDQLRLAARYASERQQFGKPIASFGLIRHKLGEMAARLYAAESAACRTADNIDQVKATGELLDLVRPGFPRSIEEFALECSIVKVSCSEILTYVCDEALQIHGGYGFTEEFQPARATRDARINRIFEGTNEINRFVIPSTILRRAQRQRLPLAPALAAALDGPVPAAPAGGGDLAAARHFLARAKLAALAVLGAALKKFGDKTGDEQEVMAAVSDMLIDIYLGESAVLRALKAAGGAHGAIHADLAVVFVNDSAARLEARARDVLPALASGAELSALLGRVRALLAWTPVDAIALRRRIAQRLGEVGSYPSLVAAR